MEPEVICHNSWHPVYWYLGASVTPFAVPDHRRQETELCLSTLRIIDSFICLKLGLNRLKEQADIALLIGHDDAMC